MRRTVLTFIQIQNPSTCQCWGWKRLQTDASVRLAPLKPVASDTFHLASPPCSPALSHPIMDFTSAARKLFFCPARLAAVPNRNQNTQSYHRSPVATERHQECAALHCGTPYRSVSAPQRCAAGSSTLSPEQKSHANSFAVPPCLPLKQKRGGNVSIRSPHGTPGPEPRHAPAHPPKRPVGMNFSIGLEAVGSLDAPLIGPTEEDDGGNGCVCEILAVIQLFWGFVLLF